MTLPPASEAYIGRVRWYPSWKQLTVALASLGGANGVIASTNGDPKVAPNWLAATLHEIECRATGSAVFPVAY